MTDQQPLVSIIIPTYNRAHLIGETLDSVLSQTYQNWECIVVDDGSTDETEEVVQKYLKLDKRFQYAKRPDDRKPGGNAARNYGFEMSKGEYINWIDSDDLSAINHLSSHIHCHQSDNNIQVSVSNARTFEGSIKNLNESWSNITPKSDCILEMINEKVLWPIGGVVWARNSIVTKSPFKEDLSSSQEWTFHLLQLINNKVKYKIIDIDSYFVRKHNKRIGAQQSIYKIESTFRSRMYIYLSLEANGYDNPAYKRKLFDRFVKVLRDYLAGGYYSLFWEYYKITFVKSFRAENKIKLFTILFLWLPIYAISGKGYKYIRV